LKKSGRATLAVARFVDWRLQNLKAEYDTESTFLASQLQEELNRSLAGTVRSSLVLGLNNRKSVLMILLEKWIAFDGDHSSL